MHTDLDYFIEQLSAEYPNKSEKEIHKAAMKLVKQRWVRSKEEWVSRKGVASELTKEDFYKLLSNSTGDDSPDFSKQEEMAVASLRGYPHNFALVGKSEIVEEASSPSLLKYFDGASKKTKNSRPNEFILLKSVLCTSLPFVNGNGDAFSPEDLQWAVESGQLDKLQPAIVDWRHDFKVYGTTIGAELVDNELEIEGLGREEVKQIIVYSVFYAWLFPYEAKKIRQWADKGILGFSMACGAEDYNFLNNSVRQLIKPHFVANSIIPPDVDPADDNARLIEIAGKQDIPVVYSSVEQVPQNLTCAWYKPEENNTGDDMDYQKRIQELEAANKKLEDKISELSKSEDSKTIAALEASITEINEEKSQFEVRAEDLTAKSKKAIADLEKAEADTLEAQTALSGTVEKLKEVRASEVDRINAERKESVLEQVGDEVKAEFWLEQFKASLGEDGEIVDPKEQFDKAMENMPKTKDVDASGKVKRSEKAKNKIATAAAEDEKKFFSTTIA